MVPAGHLNGQRRTQMVRLVITNHNTAIPRHAGVTKASYYTARPNNRQSALLLLPPTLLSPSDGVIFTAVAPYERWHR